MGGDGLDILGSGGNVTALASCTILDKYKISEQMKNDQLVRVVGCVIGSDEGSGDDCRNSELTTSSCHPAAAKGGCKRVDSWKTSRCRNPCLHPCLRPLRGSGGMEVMGREEPD